ncbi:MAG: J domain-containing protein [Vibrio sp.]
MTPWQILDLAPTSDLASIKKAYKTQLKKHHPEDDPEGFQRVRAAYETIIEELNHEDDAAIAPFSPTVNAAAQPITPAERPEAADSLAPWTQYTAIIDDPTQRFVIGRWQEWKDSLLLQPLDIQQAVASKVRGDVLEKYWLPGDIVQIFWEVFDWQELLNSNDENYHLGGFLQSRAKTTSPLPLTYLASLSAAEQRATLSFINPLTKALNIGNIAAINYWLWQPTCLPLTNILELQTLVLQCCNSCHWYPPVIHQELLQHLLTTDILAQLSAHQLEIVAQTALQTSDIDAIMSVASHMMTKNLFRQAADLLYQAASKANEHDYALVLAYLQQQWQPLPLAFWRCEHWLNPTHYSQANRSQRWLYQSLFNNADDIFRHNFDFKEETGLLGFLTRTLWNSEHGSLVWQVNLLDDLVAFQEQTPPFECLLLQLVHQHCLNCIEQQTCFSPSLREKLTTYETDEFLLSDALTEEEIESLSITQWMNCLAHHPLIPDSWLDALVQHGKLSTTIIDDHERRRHWVYVMLFQRVADPTFRFSSIYQDQPFEGVFRWLLLFNSYYTPTDGISGTELLTQLPALPAKQQHGPLGHLVEYFGHEHHYDRQWINGCEPFGQQLLFRSLTDHALNSLCKNTSLDDLKVMALDGNIESLAALSIHYRYKHLFVSTAYWQLFHTYTYNKPQFDEFHRRTRHILGNETRRQELAPETLNYEEPNAFIVFIAEDDPSQLPTPETIIHSTPNKQAQNFAYPMSYLLAILYQGWQASGCDLYPLDYFERQRKQHSEEEQHVIDTALVHLDQLHQTELNQALNQPKSLKTFSISQLFLFVLAFIGVWFFLFDYTLSDNAVKTTALWCFEATFVTIAQLGLTLRVLQVVPNQRKRKTYIGTVWLLYLLAMTFNSFWLAVATCVIHLTRILCSKVVFSRGRWLKSVAKNKHVDIAAVLSRKTQ